MPNVWQGILVPVGPLLPYNVPYALQAHTALLGLQHAPPVLLERSAAAVLHLYKAAFRAPSVPLAEPLGGPRVRIAGLDTTGRKQEAPPSLMDVMLARKGRGVLQLHWHLHQPARIAMLANTVLHLLLQ